MNTINPQTSDFHTLREELNLRPSHQLMELEVDDLLRQILPQLDWLHRQGKSHGAISLDTIAFYEGKLRLLESDTLSQGFPDPHQDIAALGHVVLQVLTGQSVESLRDVYGNWIWEDECLVTDHLADIINFMIGNSCQAKPTSVQQVLNLLNQQSQRLATGIQKAPSSAVVQTVAKPTKSFDSNAYSSQTSQVPRKNLNFNLKTWQWATLGIFCGLGTLSIVGFPVFFSQQAKAKQAEATTNLGMFVRQQQAYFVEHSLFSTQGWQELEKYLEVSGIEVSNIQEGQFYSFDSYNPTETQTVGTASAKEEGLKSYSAITYLIQSPDGQITSVSATCETDKPSSIPPQPIQLFEQGGSCPIGSSLYQGSFEIGNGYRVLREISRTQPAELHSGNTSNAAPTTSVQQALTQNEAEVIINRWLSAKSSIFGPPFDRNLLGQLAMGNTYQDNLGSIAWLQNNGYRYSYSASRIQNIWSFVTSNTTPSIKVSIYEDLTLHSPRGIDRSKSGASTRNFTYYFARDIDGQWKISDYRRSD